MEENEEDDIVYGVVKYKGGEFKESGKLSGISALHCNQLRHSHGRHNYNEISAKNTVEST